MADDDVVFGDDDVAGVDEDAGGGKRGFLPEVVLRILKFVGLGLLAVIFIVTVVIITMNIASRGTSNPSSPMYSEDYSAKPEILSWWGGIEPIRTRTADEDPKTVMVELKVGYEKDNSAIQTELIARMDPFQAMVRRYFSSKTAVELSNRYEDQIVEELKEMINHSMESGQIKDVIILRLEVIDM